MSVYKLRLYHILRLSVALLTLGALLFNTGAIWPVEASPVGEVDQITPGLRAAIQETLDHEAFAPAIEVAKLTASDGAADDYFGFSVALSGDTALVGIPYEDDNGNSSGSAYIFERDQGGTDNWGQVIKIAASDGAAEDYLGYSVALEENTALVGAYRDDGIGVNSGSVYIFERDQGGIGNWGEVKKLTASDSAAGDEFGISVSLSGDTVLVGARRDDDNGTYSGSAYIFERDEGGADNWGEVKKLTASDGAADDEFGFAVALSGDIALVGSPYDDDDGADSGSSYLFERNQDGAGNWGQAKKLTASDGATIDYFGYSVALSGDTALVGTLYANSVYLFERDQGGAGNWGQIKILTASDGGEGEFFGGSLTLSGDTALVGAYNDANGSAYIYERDQGGADNWGETAKLIASDGAASDFFGYAVALSGDTALVGSPYDDDDGSYSGSAYVFSSYLINGGFEDPLGAEWTEVVSANGDGRIPLKKAYLGSYIYLFKADGGLEIIRQTVAASGIAGDEYTLTFYFGGKNVDLSGKLGARVMFKNGGVKVDKKLCVFTPPSSSFSWSSFTCTLTATGAFDSIEVIIGIQNVASGMVGVDVAVLNKTGEAP